MKMEKLFDSYSMVLVESKDEFANHYSSTEIDIIVITFCALFRKQPVLSLNCEIPKHPFLQLFWVVVLNWNSIWDKILNSLAALE